jgi:GxxExxY protein
LNHEDTKTRGLGVSSRFDERIETIAGHVVDAAYHVHRALGPGLLEGVYEACLRHELVKRGHEVEAQVGVPVLYDGLRIDLGVGLDLLVDKLFVVEVKATEQVLPVHRAQVLTYLKVTGLQLGFLINFNVLTIKEGIKRVAL